MQINDNNKFFKCVWRFNVLIIACAAFICILLGGFAAIKIFMNETRERRVANVVNVGEKVKVKDEFVLGHPYTIDGTDYVRVPLYRDQSYDMSYYSKDSGGNEVNYLFMSSSNGESRWLMQAANQLFVSDVVLLEKLKVSRDESNKAVGIVYAVVENDTNNDNRLSDKDAITIGTSSFDGLGTRS